MGNFRKKVLKNGMTILFEKRKIPVTTLMLAAKYGSGYECISEKGIAHFIEHLCFKGTKKRDAKAIASEVEKAGGDLNAFTHEEITSFYAKVPSKCLRVAADVIFDIFFNAEMPSEEVEKEANVICEEIKMYYDNPRYYVCEKIKENLYEGSFGAFGAGSEESVRSMNREMLFKRHREVYTPSNSILCVVGNNEFEEVIKLAEEFSVKRDLKNPIFPEIKKKSASVEEKRDGLMQANIAIGFHFPYEKKEDRIAGELFSTILGQGMSSKLFSEVREKRGLVYGIKSILDIGSKYGYMIIWAGTDVSKKDEVIEVSLNEFYKMKDLSLEELNLAKKQLVGNKSVLSENSSEVASNLILEEIKGGAENYYTYEEDLNKIGLDKIKSLCENKKHSLFVLYG